MVSITVDDNTVLRTHERADAQDLFDAIDRSRRHLHTWLNWVDNTLSPEHSLQFIQRSLQELNMQESLALGIFYNDAIIGGMGMHHWDQTTKRAQVGYWICKEYEGKGIMYKSLLTFIDFLFNKIGLNKIEIHFLTANVRSAKLAERLGFRTEGVIRQSQLWNGKPQDIVIAGLLKDERKTV